MPSRPTQAADHVPQTRAAALADYVNIARSLGLDAYAMLREFGIDPRLLADPEARLPADAVSRLLEESVRRSGCESIGLLLAEKRSFASLGPLSLLLRHERTLRSVFGRLVQYRRLMSDVIEYDLDEEGEDARIRVGLNTDLAGRQGVELVMALTFRFLDQAMFGGWHPFEAHFRHPAPADEKVHRRIFRCPLRFDAAFNGFLCSTAELDRENAYADAGFARHAQRFADLLSEALPELSFADQVRTAVRSLLPMGEAGLTKVAAHLRVHPRALQRRLATEGCPFTSLVEDIREELARDLLANTRLPLAEVAVLAGYASPTSFSRWFSARVGQSPRDWRAASRPPA
jgi:AraC-like DNA-binding protein